MVDETTGDLKSTFDIFDDLSEHWDKMSNAEKQSVALAYAGKNQFEVFSSVMSNFSQATEAAKTALESQGSAIKENSRYMESFKAQLNGLKDAWNDVVLAFANSEAISDLILALTNSLNAIAQSEKVINSITLAFKALAVYFGGKAVISFGKGLVSDFKSIWTQLVKVVGVLKKVPRILANIKKVGLTAEITRLISLAPKLINPYVLGFLSIAAVIGVASGKFKEWHNELKLLLTDDLNEQAEALGNLVTTWEAWGTKQRGTSRKRVTGDEAIDVYIEKLTTLNEKYEEGILTAEAYLNQMGDISSLQEYYEKLDEIVTTGGTLTETQQTQYNQLKNLLGVYSHASTEVDNYNKHMALLEDYANGNVDVLETYKNVLVKVGDQYYFTSKAAKESAIATQEAIIAEANGVIQATEKEIEARKSLAEVLAGTFQSSTNLNTGDLLNPLPYMSAEEKAEYDKQLAIIDSANTVISKLKSINIQKVSIGGTTSGTTGPKSSSKTDSEEKKKATNLYNSYKKQLEKYQEAQKEAYQKGEITASEYYSNVQKKGKSFYDKLKSMGSNYADAAEDMLKEYQSTNTDSVKDIFDEISYQYKQSNITAQEYYNQLWKYAKKFYNNGKLEFEDYRDYIEDGYEALFNSIEDEYDDGKITAEEYAKKVAKTQSDALKKIASSTLDASTKQQLATLINKFAKEAQKSVAKALKEAAVEAAEAAVEAAEAALEKAENRQSLAESYINALDFYAEEQQAAIDKVIDGYNEEIDKLNEKMDLLDEQNDALDDQAERIKLVNELEDAKKQKTVRVFDSKLGWVWTSDASRVASAQEAIDEFDTTKKREEEKKAIENEIKAIEKLIDEKEDEKQAYQDVIDEQVKALNRYNIEAELGKSIEEAIFDGRIENFNNWKDSYLSGMDEVIDSIRAVSLAQAELDSLQVDLENAQQALSDFEQNYVEDTTETRFTSKTGAEYTYDSSKSSVENWNAAQKANIAARQAQGWTVKSWYDDEGKLHYKKAASGTLSVPKSALYNVNELGDELIVPPRGNFDYLKKGTGVIPANLTKNLMDWGRFNPSTFLNSRGVSNTDDHSVNIQNLTIQSNDAKDFVRQLQNLAIVRG